MYSVKSYGIMIAMDVFTQAVIAIIAIALGYWLGKKFSERRKEFPGVVGEQSEQKDQNLCYD